MSSADVQLDGASTVGVADDRVPVDVEQAAQLREVAGHPERRLPGQPRGHAATGSLPPAAGQAVDDRGDRCVGGSLADERSLCGEPRR